MQTWKEIYEAPDIDKKAALFQSMIYDSYCKIFHKKEIQVREDDRPWFTEKLKHLNRKKKREFVKNQKSEKWKNLSKEFKDLIKIETEKYYSNTLKDLKASDPRRWYLKLKKMMGKPGNVIEEEEIEELEGISNEKQAEKLVDFYASTRNEFEAIN